MSAPGARVLRFAGFTLDPARRRLTGPEGEAVPLQPRVFDLLALFLAHPGEPLSKQAIMDAVWPDTTVDENNLNQAVSTLRRALGEPHGEPRLIATLPRRGYQLIVPVEEVAEETPAAAPVLKAPAYAPLAAGLASWWSGRPWSVRLGLASAPVLSISAVLAAVLWLAPAPAPPDASIAVLPFRDLSAAGDQGYFADGVAEEILDELAQLDGLRVAGRLSSAAAAQETQDPRAIGRTLGVSYVLAGGVRKDGDRLRVSAQLVSAADGFQVWTRTYDRQLDDVFAIQDEIAASVTEALTETLGVPAVAARRQARYGTASADAYDHYLRGRAYWAQTGAQDLRAALEELTRAAEIDPGFGPAWAGLAHVADFLSLLEPQRADELLRVAEDAARRAREAAPDDWASVAVQARLLMRAKDWRGAAEVLREADAVAHPSPVEAAEIKGVFLMQVGRAREARDVFEAARVSDPLSFTMAASTAWALDLAGQPEAARAMYQHAQTLPGDDAAWVFQQLLRLMRAGDTDAVDVYFASYPYESDATGALLRKLAAVWWSPQAALDLVRAAIGEGAIQGPSRIDALALLAAYYGDAELAIGMFRDELFERGGGATVHLWHPLMAEARRTEGFKRLVTDLGLVDYWRATGDWSDFCRPLGETDFECF